MTQPFNIITALDDPELFGPWFPGATWVAWKAVIKAIFAIPMNPEERDLFQAVSDRDAPSRRVKEFYGVAARRTAKTSVASAICAFMAAIFDGTGVLRPGERALVLCLAVDRDQARICLDLIRAFFHNIPMLAEMVKRETRNGFLLANDVEIIVGTNDFRSVRGRPILCAVFDECAFYRSENTSTPDLELYRAIVPGMATIPGALLIGISSPYRKSGLLYNKFKQYFGRDDDRVLVIRAPAKVLNPTLDQDIIDQALADDPVGARSEWLAEFRDDIGGWLALEIIEAAVDRAVTLRPPRPSVRYRSFCDPSGGARDSFTAAISHDEGNTSVLDCLLEIKPPFNPSAATEQIASTLRSYGLQATTGDRYGAEWVVEAFRRVGIKYAHSERDRSQIYLDVLPLFTSGRVKLLDNQRLVSQFASLERRTSPIGKDRVDHGPGGHDDLCNAAAGALITKGRPVLHFSNEFIARSRAPGPHTNRRRALA